MTIETLKKHFPGEVLDMDYPKAYPHVLTDPLAIKGIVLGCDPSNSSNKDGTTRELETVFGIQGKGKDGRYFTGILKNLKVVGLSLSNIYVQNLCRNYFKQVTAKNKSWTQAAKLWSGTLKAELDDLNIPKTVPVFLTSLYLYKALLKPGVAVYSAEELYRNTHLQPIAGKDNLLERPLLMLFRGGKGEYKLENWPAYTGKIRQLLKTI